MDNTFILLLANNYKPPIANYCRPTAYKKQQVNSENGEGWNQNRRKNDYVLRMELIYLTATRWRGIGEALTEVNRTAK